jgi:hypothetical protein
MSCQGWVPAWLLNSVIAKQCQRLTVLKDAVEENSKRGSKRDKKEKKNTKENK